MVVTGTQRKSITDLLHKKSVIGKATTELICLYELEPEHIRDITTETLCPPNARFSYTVNPIHFETTVNFSAPLHHIDCLRTFYASKKMPMLGYLANEMLLGFFVTNNPFRYNEFAKMFVESVIKNRGELPLAKGDTFLGKCQEFITGEFGSFNGTEDTNKLIKGAPRWQSTNNHPRFEHNNFHSLCSFEEETHRQSKVTTPSMVDHKTLMTSLIGSVSGVGKLLSQKLMFADAIVGLHLGSNWLRHCIPGSGKHLNRLKKQYGFQYAPQVSQLIHSIASQLNILPMKAEEIVCKLLKGNDSKYFDPVFEGQNLFYVDRNDDGEIEVHKVNGETGEVSKLASGGFDLGVGSHYYPSWMSTQRDFSTSGNVVHMSSVENRGIYAKKDNNTEKDKKEYNEYVPSASAANFSLYRASLCW